MSNKESDIIEGLLAILDIHEKNHKDTEKYINRLKDRLLTLEKDFDSLEKKLKKRGII
jgi:hypothetical protein